MDALVRFISPFPETDERVIAVALSQMISRIQPSSSAVAAAAAAVDV